MKKSEIKVPFQVLSVSEREVIFRIADDEDRMSVYAASPKWYREIVSKGYTPTRLDAFGAEFEIPRITVPKAERRRLSEAQKANLMAGKARNRSRAVAKN